jgi:pimeloyl-ACP methyl ester carboxylesterase
MKCLAVTLAIIVSTAMAFVGGPHAAAQAGQPTIVLVHGAWADPTSWDAEAKVLRSKGYRVDAIVNPLRNLTTDARSVSDYLHTVSGPVVLVGHSYGGSVITEAAAHATNVAALVYVDAYLPDVGESASILNGDDSAIVSRPDDQIYDTAPYPDAPEGAVDLRLKEDFFLHDFASDLPAARATELWATQTPTSTSALKTPNSEAAWKSLPSWAFISTGDHIITPAAKRSMALRARARITTFDGGSHLSLISHPDAVTEVIEAAATSVP